MNKLVTMLNNRYIIAIIVFFFLLGVFRTLKSRV